MEVAITDENNQDPNWRVAEVGPTSTLGSAKHNAAQSDAPRLEQGELRKFHVHNGQGGRQRAPSPASSERVLFNENFYAKSAPQYRWPFVLQLSKKRDWQLDIWLGWGGSTQINHDPDNGSHFYTESI